ncbi:hypothetical protein [Georgenia sp. SUBG003]|uniref:hypothetical protein n=1 Tax=Georgenia sp. SUBG003 TaxID=1497974 RepID=UPI0004D953C8|nr:hypothetical protein DA06_16560 [Georgenia sp. SUBG003]
MQENPTTTRNRLGLSAPTIVLLAGVAGIRVPLHDLGVLDEGTVAAFLLAVVPLGIWVAVALWRRVPNPVLTLTVVGLAYGVVLATVHQLMWDVAFDGDGPRLGGNLAGVLDPAAESLLLRTASVPSSLLTGAALGLLAGAVAWAIRRVTAGPRGIDRRSGV